MQPVKGCRWGLLKIKEIYRILHKSIKINGSFNLENRNRKNYKYSFLKLIDFKFRIYNTTKIKRQII